VHSISANSAKPRRKQMGETTPNELKYQAKLLDRILEDLRSNWLFVEGQKDKLALKHLGCEKIKTISGNLRKSCMELPSEVEKVIVLTDLDRRGDEQLKAAKDELEGLSIEADIKTRVRFAAILNLRYFEHADRLFHEFIEKLKEKKVT
jgi:5S rRNA maturation endonuclease (ribonuclease M5)